MPRKISKSTISKSTKSADMTFSKTVKRQFLYSRLAIIGSPTRVETYKGSERVFGLTPKFTGVTKERVASGSNKE